MGAKNLKRRILPIFHGSNRYNRISNINNQEDKDEGCDNESRFLSSPNNQQNEVSVRSSPSMRHLNADGSSGEQLHELLEKVVSSKKKNKRNKKGVPVVLSKFRRGNRMREVSHTSSTQSDSLNINSIPNVEVRDPKEYYAEDIENVSDSKESYGVISILKESKRSIFTDESSGGKLQGILEKLVEQDSTMDSTAPLKFHINKVNAHVKGVQSSFISSAKASNEDVIDTAPTSFDELEHTNEPIRTRFEMFDPNEQSKIYLQQRQRQGKKPKRRLPPVRPEHLRSRNVLKNCGLLPELQLSPGSTISMSSCSIDSILDNPERLEKYRILSQPPPSPPPRRRNSDHTDFIENTWTDDILKTIWETYGKVSRLIGCVSS